MAISFKKIALFNHHLFPVLDIDALCGGLLAYYCQGVSLAIVSTPILHERARYIRDGDAFGNCGKGYWPV